MKNELEIVSHPRLKYINCFLVDMDYRTPHRHDEIELNLVIDGSIHTKSMQNYTSCTKNDILLLNPNQPHEIKSETERALILCLQISPKFCADHFPFLANVYFENSHLSEAVSDELFVLFRSLIIEFAYQYFSVKEGYSFTCYAILNSLIYLFITNLPHHTISDEDLKKTTRHTARLNRILNYMEENFMHKLLLSDIAKKENLSTSYLSHFIKENLNQSFQEYLYNLRFNHARMLVATTDKRLIDICIESGFSDYRYLYSAFRDHYDCTPSEYRQQHKGESDPSRKAARFSNEIFVTTKETLDILTGLHDDIKPVISKLGLYI